MCLGQVVDVLLQGHLNLAQQVGQVAADGAGDARAQEGVHEDVGDMEAVAQDAVALVEVGDEGEQTYLLKLGVVGVAAGIARATEVANNVRAGLGQVAGGHEAIPPVVAGANEDGDVQAGDVGFLLDGVGDGFAGIFHHPLIRDTRHVRRLFRRDHLRHGKNLHLCSSSAFRTVSSSP